MKFNDISNLIDCHSHSDNSPDGFDSVSKMCSQAEKLGLFAYALTDHCEVNGYENDSYRKRMEKSFSEICKEKEKNYKTKLLAGIELGQPLQDPNACDEALKIVPYDFVIGSLHNITNQKDFYYLNYNTHCAEDFLAIYFDELIDMVKWGHFDVLGHLTYPLRYVVGDWGIPIDMARFEKKIREILHILAETGKGIEINSSGLRQKIGDTMPSYYYVKMFKELGGEYLSIGSDAHKTIDLGKGIYQAAQIAKKAGFTELTYFEERKPHKINISHIEI